MKIELLNDLEISLDWYESIFSFKRKITIPYKEIAKVSNEEPGVLLGIKMPGTYIPMLFRAGTFYTKLGKEFWYYYLKKTPLVLEMKQGSKYKRIILGIDNAEYIKDQIQSKIKHAATGI